MLKRINYLLYRLGYKLEEYGLYKVNEMATIGYFSEYTVVIESNDHNPPHFHVKLNNKTISKIEIPKTVPAKTYDLVYMKSSKARLRTSEEKRLLEWLNQPSRQIKSANNLVMLQAQWNIGHPEDEISWS